MLSPTEPAVLPRDGADDSWSTIIRPESGFFDLGFKELWQHRSLITLFAWRDFISVYKQTILGPLWYLVQPLLVAGVFTVIFGEIARLPTDGVPPFLFYFCGTVLWNYFAGCLNKTSNTFLTNANLFGKVYFPRLVVPLSVLISNLLSFFIQLLMLIAMLIFFTLRSSSISPNGWLILTPFLLILTAALALGLGCIISSLTTRYRDLTFLVTFGLQLWMYGTPIIYPASAVPEYLQKIIAANPLTPVVEAFRHALLGSGNLNFAHLGYSLGVTIVILLTGIVMFNRVQSTFTDTI